MIDEAFIPLNQILEGVYKLSSEDRNAFCSIWKPHEAKRKEILTVAGDTEKYLYFVNEGVQRVFYLDETGREATIVFTYAPSFGGVIDSFMMQRNSLYNYETLTPSRFLRTTYDELHQLMKQHESIESMILQGITQAMSGILERLVELQCYSSEEKFRKLLLRSPHILQLVPHKYLANYLGIDATNFSKLMNKVRI